MLQYMRKVSAEFPGGFIINPGGINLHELKIAFDIEKSVSSTPNSAVIEIWNLNEGHRNSVGKEFDEITLKAGYMPPAGMTGQGILNYRRNQGGFWVPDYASVATGTAGNVGIIFKGAVRDVEHRRDGPDIITRISCGDGDKAFRRAKISKSFQKGTRVEEVVEELYKQMEKEGVSRGEWKFPEDMPPDFKRPYATCGSCARELDTIGRGKKFYWSMQNQTLEIIPSDGFVGQMVVLNSRSGLIDCPTITDNGVKVSALLNPEIRPNRRVKVESDVLEMNAANGVYRVSQCNYTGDNRDGDFRVDIHGEAITGKKVDEGKK